MSTENDSTTIQSTPTAWTELHFSVSQSLIDFAADSVSSVADLISNDTNTSIETTTNDAATFVEVPYEDYKYRPETYIVPIIFGLIFFAGLMGNGMLIAVFIKHRAMRNVPNT